MEVSKYRKLLPSQSVASGFAGSNPALPTNNLDEKLNTSIMTSVNKKKKLKNSYCYKTVLKHKTKGPKRIAFFNASLRKKIKQDGNES